MKRWIAFNGVGLMGVAVQLCTLAAVMRLTHVHYLVATAVAVESAVLHNFIWHHRWTWRDRSPASRGTTLHRLVRFHLLNGVISMAGNLTVMRVCTGMFGVDPLAANAASILLCSLVNFVASDNLVFQRPRPGSTLRRASHSVVVLAGILAFAGSDVAADERAAEPKPTTLAAWNAYEAVVDSRYAALTESGTPFFVQDEFGGGNWRQTAMTGGISMLRVDSASPRLKEPSVPDGRIHHWVGAVFVPGASLEATIKRLQERAGHESESYDDVVASRLLGREGDRLRIYMKLRRENIITVTYNTEHTVVYRRLGRTRTTSRSEATRIAELAEVGTPREHEKASGTDSGFLWRLNAYWRFEQTDRGVLIECESVSLSRSVPVLLRPFITGTVERIARESLEKTLRSLRTVVSTGSPASASFHTAGLAPR